MSLPASTTFDLVTDHLYDPGAGTPAPGLLRIENGIIAERLPAETPSGHRERLDLTGNLVLPTLVDSHVHAYMNPWPLEGALRTEPGLKPLDEEVAMAVARLREALLSGVGVMRDLGDPHGINREVVRLAKTDSSLPRMQASGKAIFREGRYGRFLGSAVADLKALLDAVRTAAVDPEVSVVKLVPTGIINFKKGCVTTAPQFSQAELTDAVALAHDLGKKVAAHCSGADGVAQAALAGVDFIEHGYFISKESLDLMKEKNLVWSPTFAPVYVQWKYAERCGWDEPTRDNLRRILDGHGESLRHALSIGLPLMAGSDAGGVGVSHGGGVHLELACMQEAGMEARDLVRMATVFGREQLGEAKAFAVGSPADFMVTDPAALSDVRLLTRLTHVAREGRVQRAVAPVIAPPMVEATVIV